MDVSGLKKLLEILPDGDWNIRPAEYPNTRLVVAVKDGRETVIASDLTPEAASFLLLARQALPELMQAVEEEKAYYANLEEQNKALTTAANDLREQLQAQQTELYELERFGLEGPVSTNIKHPAVLALPTPAKMLLH